MAGRVNFSIINVSAQQPTRLDRYLRRIFPYLTQGMIEKSLRRREILLNGKKAQSSIAVLEPDIIEYKTTLFSKKMPVTAQNELNFSTKTIALAEKLLGQFNIFTCEEFIAIDKPAGLATQGGSKIDLSIDHALFFLNQTTNSNYKLVHRLDKATSGILLIAKGFDHAASLAKAFQNQLISKKYIALVVGKPPKMSGNLIHYLAKTHNGKLELIKDMRGGKRAETDYELVKYDAQKQISLLNFFPKTGRMHQLRIQANFLGCPILGDLKYGLKYSLEQPCNHSYFKQKRMYLHASYLSIDAKIFGRPFNIQAKTPAEFTQLIDLPKKAHND